MRLRPGGTWWLLRHEIRMAFSGARKLRPDGGERRFDRLAVGLFVLLQAGLHFVAWQLVRLAHTQAFEPRQTALALTGVVFVLVTLMLAVALRGSVGALFERGDLDLLLSSPLPARSIFVARLGAVAFNSAAGFLFLLAPLANMGALAGHPRWLAIYPVVAGAALLIASAAMLATLGLVRLLGTRRTRVLAQVLATFSGAAIFLLFQLMGNNGDLRTVAWEWLRPRVGTDAWWMLPGHALQADPAALAALLAAGIGAFLFTVRTTEGIFVRGVAVGAGMARVVARPRDVTFRFGASPFRAVLRKEWRLIVRDPQLISQVALQLVYLVPVCVALFRAGDVVAAAAPLLTYLCGALAGALAWVVIAAEDAPDLLAGAPLPRHAVLRAKAAAAALPPLALVAVPLLWVASRAPLAGLVLAAGAVAAALSAVYVVLRSARPASRAQFAQRAKGNLGSTLLEFLSNVGWAVAAYCAFAGPDTLPWAFAALAGPALALAGAWLADPAARRTMRSAAT